MSQLNFDARQVAPQQTFDPIPAGWYNAMITESEIKPTSNGQGAYLQMTIKVVDGAHAGRQVFDRLNLQNANPVASEIAYRRLSAYCHATGVIQVQDSQQLHGIPFKVRVSIRTDNTGQYEPSNEVKAIKHISEEAGPQVVGAPQAPAGPPPGWTPPGQAPQPPAGPPAGWAPPAQAPMAPPASQQWAPPAQAPVAAAPLQQWTPPPVVAPAPVAPPQAATAPNGAPPWANAAPAPTGAVPPWVKQ